MADECEAKIFEGDVGTEIRFKVWTCDETVDPHVVELVDISSAVPAYGDIDIIFIRPAAATQLKVDGVFETDGTDSLCKHVSVVDDLVPFGDWIGQARIKLIDGRWATSTIEFEVFEKLFDD